MVNSEEIVERTFYICLLNILLKAGLTLNPDDYLPLSVENEKRFNQDKDALPKFVYLFGVGNNQVRGAKIAPRITLELNGYFPGDVGIPHIDYYGKDVDTPFQVVEFPWEVKDLTLDVHLVANTQQDMRMLHKVLHQALPVRGYIVPYLDNDFEAWKEKRILKEGNLFIELTNYYDHPDLDHGLLGKTYTYLVKDGILEMKKAEDGDLTPIKDISLLIGHDRSPESEHLSVQIPE